MLEIHSSAWSSVSLITPSPGQNQNPIFQKIILLKNFHILFIIPKPIIDKHLRLFYQWLILNLLKIKHFNLILYFFEEGRCCCTIESSMIIG